MVDINQIIKDPKFWEYSSETQSAILDKVDPRFKKLSPEAKKLTIANLTPETEFEPFVEKVTESEFTGNLRPFNSTKLSLKEFLSKTREFS